MTTSICTTLSVAGLPPIAYDHLYDPDEAHRFRSATEALLDGFVLFVADVEDEF